MPADNERIERIRAAMELASLDALVCTLPANVLLVTGYWPVICNAIAVVTRDGRSLLIAPEDELEFAEKSWSGNIYTFKSDVEGSGDERLRILKESRILNSLVKAGYEGGLEYTEAPYVGMRINGYGFIERLRNTSPECQFVNATELLEGLKSKPTPSEIEQVARACNVAGTAFSTAIRTLTANMREIELAAYVQVFLSVVGNEEPQVDRAGGYAFCMSGPRAALAYRSYACSSSRQIGRHELVLVHCNSYIGGFWTDITRTYCTGPPDERQTEMYEAVLKARQVAIGLIRPGTPAREVDKAVRDSLSESGFGDAIKHSTGHGVGFAAINHNAKPRLSQDTDDVLETGMIFNIEPAIYLDGYGAVRHCDVVCVTEDGARVLTPFQARIDELIA